MSQAVAVSTLIVTPKGIVMILDERGRFPFLWKFPGGKGVLGKSTNSLRELAIHKVKQKTNISLTRENLTLLHEENRGNHHFVLFGVKLQNTPTLPEKRAEFRIKIFPLDETLITRKDVFSKHRTFFNQNKIQSFIQDARPH